MGIVNGFFNGLFNVLFWPFRGLDPWVGMIVVALLTSFLMLLIFRHTSNQAGIRREKNRIKAHLLELRLFQDNMAVQFRAQGRILLANLKYIGHNSKPMLVMLIPVLLILIQLEQRYGSSALKPGEAALVKVKLAKGYLPTEVEAGLESTPEVEIETPPLRIEDEGEIDWRIRARSAGSGRITLTVGAERLEKSVAVGGKAMAPISVLRTGRGFIDQALNPGEAALPSSSAVKAIEIRYPSARMKLFGLKLHWLVVYFVLSIAFGFAFKGVFKVEI
jgi:uncharacterized membrane protein (DUF106 family)